MIGTAYVEVKPDTKGFGDEAERSVLGRVGSVAKKAAALFAVAFASERVASFFTGAISQASALGESLSKNTVVFGKHADAVIAFSKNAATGLGQSQAQALEATGTFGNLLRAVGLSEDVSAKFSTTMVTLASDLASFNNTDPTEALDALRSGLVGETEPLKRFGVNLNEALLKQKALDLGLTDGKGVLDANAKAQAAYALIMEQTALAQGDFARTSGGLANQQRILGARFSDLQARIGTAFLPIVTKVVTFLSERGLPALEAFGRGVGAVGAAIGRVVGPIVATVVEAVRAMVNAFQAADNFGFSSDEGLLGFLINVGATARRVVDTVVDTIRSMVNAFQAADNFGFSTSDGPLGFFINLAVVVRRVVDVLVDNLRPAFTNLRPVLAALGAVIAAVVLPPLIATAVAVVTATAPFIALAAAAAGLLVVWNRFPIVRDVVGGVVEFVGRLVGRLVGFFVSIAPQVQEALGHVVAVVETVLGVIAGAWDVFGADLLRIVTVVFDQVRNYIDFAINTVMNIIRLVLAVINGDWGKAWDALKAIVVGAFDFVIATVQNLGSLLVAALGILWDLVRLGARAAWDGFTSLASSAIEGVVDFVLALPGRLLALRGALIDAALSLGRSLIEGIGRGIAGAADFVGDLGRQVANGVIGFVNRSVIDRINDALEFRLEVFGQGVTIDAPDLPYLPRLAGGALLRARPGGVAFVGAEAGRDEAVIPLPPGLLDGLQRLAGVTGGAQVTGPLLSMRVTVEAGVDAAKVEAAMREVARAEIVPALNEAVRRVNAGAGTR